MLLGWDRSSSALCSLRSLVVVDVAQTFYMLGILFELQRCEREGCLCSTTGMCTVDLGCSCRGSDVLCGVHDALVGETGRLTAS